MQRRLGDIGNIHGNLSYAVFLDKPTNRFRPFQCSRNHNRISVLILQRFSGNLIPFPFRTPFFPHIERNGIGTAGRGSIQIEIHSNQEITRTDYRSSRTGNPLIINGRPEIGSPLRIRHFLSQSFILTGTAYGKVTAFRNLCRFFITINRNRKLFAYPSSQFARISYRFLHRNPGYRNQRQHIRRSDTGMFPRMFPHIDNLRRLFYRTESRFTYSLGLSDKRNDRTVGRCSRINIQ